MRPLALALALVSTTALAVPMQTTHQGRLFDADGVPLDGDHEVTFGLYADPGDTEPAWSETQTLTFESGYYVADLGADPANPLDDALFDGPLHLGLAVGGDALPGMLPIASVPFAVRAGTATNVRGGVVDATEIRIDGEPIIDADGIGWDALGDVPDDLADGDDDALGALACAAGQLAIHDGNGWLCGAADDHAHDASALTSGTLSVARLPVGTGEDDVAAGRHTHSAADTVGGVFSVDRLPVGAGADQVAAGDHGHGWDQLGDVPFDNLPVGTSALEVAAGQHTHRADEVTDGVFDVARLPVGTTASDVAAGDHGHTAADVGALPSTGGTVSGDVVIAGDLVVDGFALPVTRSFTGPAWKDTGRITFHPSANASYVGGQGAMEVGANFSGSSHYATVPLVPAGVLSAEDVLSVAIAWTLECRTTDCDAVFRLTDGDGNFAQLQTYDNSGGGVGLNGSGMSGINYDYGMGYPNQVALDLVIGGKQATGAAWTLENTGNRRWGAREVPAVLDPSTGLELRIYRGDVGEGFRHRMLRVRVDRG